MLVSSDIYKLVEIETKVKVATLSRQRKYVYARGIANTLCKEFTDESFSEIGSITGLDHASIMNSIKAFRNTYIHYSKFHRDAYMKLREYLIEVKAKEARDELEAKEVKTEEAEEVKKIDMQYIDLTYKYIELQNENELLKYQVRKRMEEFEEERFAGNPLIALVDQVPPEKIELIQIRIEAMLKML